MMHIYTDPVKEKVSALPVALDKAKKQLQIESSFTDDDEHITGLIGVAREIIETASNSDVVETTNTIEVEVGREGLQNLIKVHRAPLKSFTSLSIKETGGGYSELVNGTDYTVEPGFSQFTIKILTKQKANFIKIVYVSGYSTSDIPKTLAQAILIKVTDLYTTERGTYTAAGTANTAYQSLIMPHTRTYHII